MQSYSSTFFLNERFLFAFILTFPFTKYILSSVQSWNKIHSIAPLTAILSFVVTLISQQPCCECDALICTLLPVCFEVSQASLEVIEEIDFLAALRAVDVQQVTVVQLLHLLRSVAAAAFKTGQDGTNNQTETSQTKWINSIEQYKIAD